MNDSFRRVRTPSPRGNAIGGAHPDPMMTWTRETSVPTRESEGRRASRRVEGGHAKGGTVVRRPVFSLATTGFIYGLDNLILSVGNLG